MLTARAHDHGHSTKNVNLQHINLTNKHQKPTQKQAKCREFDPNDMKQLKTRWERE